ncbi:hypothetical protein [Hwangdonia seohaensis]|uniref:DUF4105 domain-containing protein n=1 Tax=Hwangdonia seohaensis TaxID=1240727 RepID=A0ABW3RFX0_9FLAO|nr:hypothetical protein [Hwangdonia seohaensis]
MKRLIIFLILTGFFGNSHAQKTEVEKYYVRADTSFIDKLANAYNISTDTLLITLGVNDKKREYLGFGYEFKESGKGAGSMSFDYQILYYKNKVVAYTISTSIPKKSKKLKKIYRKKLSKIFRVDDDFKVSPIKFNHKNAESPLPGIEVDKSPEFNAVMSPFSGIFFGDYCGNSMSLLNNRKLFDELINSENCNYFLYSKNPASRMMAIEYFYNNKLKFDSTEVIQIENRVQEIIKYSPYIRHCQGCIVYPENTNKIISKLKKHNQF